MGISLAEQEHITLEDFDGFLEAANWMHASDSVRQVEIISVAMSGGKPAQKVVKGWFDRLFKPEQKTAIAKPKEGRKALKGLSFSDMMALASGKRKI